MANTWVKAYLCPSGVFVPPSEQFAPDTGLDARYGRTPRRSLQRRWFVAGVAGAFVLALAAWLVWAGLLAPAAQLEATDTGHVVVSDSRVNVRFAVTVDPGRKVGCALEALDESFTVVGWKLVDLPVSSDRTRTFSEDVRTSEQAVTGLIYRCWLE
jgi:Domain of unknown function (DUF4307)